MGENYHEKVRALIQEQGTCVLATASENRPHCSLMAYTSNPSCSEIYMVTLRDSRKYKNMQKNQPVSILIDTRQNPSSPGHSETVALTLSGRFQPVSLKDEKERILKEISHRHPGFKDFFKNPEAEPVKIIIESFLLLEGPTKASQGNISGE